MISCIVPVYNCEQFLSECLDSILMQTYSDFEVLLIDDGSKDQSGDICKRYAVADKRIKYYWKQNGGAASARNLGLEKAQGEYISFVDSDDVLDLHFFEKLMETALQTNADMVVSSVEKGYGSNGILLPDVVFDQKRYIEKALTDVEYIAVFSLCTKLIKRCIIEENHLRMPEDCQLSEDQIFIIQLMGIADSVATISYAGYFYRDNPSSLTHLRENPEVVSNIIKAEKLVCKEMETMLMPFAEDHALKRWLEEKKKRTLFAMDSYIIKSNTGIREKWSMRKQLFGLITPNSTAIQNIPLNTLLRHSLAKQSVFELSLWLFIMRSKQKLKRQWIFRH